MSAVGTDLRVGFACQWAIPPEGTWSGTPWHLRAALRQRCELVDLPGQRGRITRGLFNQAHRAGLTGGTAWRVTRLNEILTERRIRAGCRRSRPDVVVQTQDLAATNEPFWLYQDLSNAVLSRWFGRVPGGTATPPMSGRVLNRRTRRQRALYPKAAGVFTMSRWLADQLIADGDVDASRVHVVHAGANAAPTEPARARTPDPAHPELLFVGRDFVRKGGDIAVAALRVLRAGGVDAQLTVAGPTDWPLDGDIPAGVHFVGAADAMTVAHLMDTADAFVLPSRFEPFGIVVLEALARGLPVVAPNAFAMPELVEPGTHGVLVDGDSADDLARAIADVVGDGALHTRCAAAAEEVRRRFSWDSVAERMLTVLSEAP